MIRKTYRLVVVALSISLGACSTSAVKSDSDNGSIVEQKADRQTNRVEDKIDQKTDRAVDSVVDKIFDKVF